MLIPHKRLLASFCLLFITLAPNPATAFIAQAQDAKKGKIEGQVVNVQTSAPVVKAGVEVVGKNLTVKTGVDGAYSLTLEPGAYNLRFFKEGFNDQLFENVEVVAGETIPLDSPLSPVGQSLGEVVVQADNASTLVAMIEERKAATTISDTITATEISKDTASNAQGVLQRVPGISIQDRFVFVRGLGERYSNTSLNDSVLPTTEPDRKVVPMDLVPANLLQNVKVLKTFTPDQPGEFSGGLVKMDTVELPKSASLSASFSVGFNSQTTGKDFLTYPGDRADFFGFSRNGRRELPALIPRDRRVQRQTVFGGQVVIPGFTPEELQTIGRAFENVWEPRAEEGRPELGWSVAGGRSFGKFGLVGALSFKNEPGTQSQIRNFYRVSGPQGEIEPYINYTYDVSTELARLGGVLNLAYEFDKNNKLFFKNFLTNQGTDEARIFQGFNGDRNNILFNRRLRYIEERIYTGQVAGDHLLTWLGDAIFTWRFTYSRATLDEPDLREVLYEFDRSGGTGEFIYLNQTQSFFRLFNEMRENVREPAADVSKYFFFNGGSINVKGGFSLSDRDRVFRSRRFRYVPRSVTGLDLTLPPEQLLAPGNINPDTGFEFREETRDTDFYDALHNISAGYGMFDLSLRNWRFIGGVRAEHSTQAVNTLEQFNPNPTVITADLEGTDYLPSLGIAYSFYNNNMAVRAGYSNTVARPQFRELTPFEFTDVTGGPATIGNPDLERTTVRNFDLRYEWYVRPGELLAVSGFYKRLGNPIETFFEATTLVRRTFANVPKARNRGLEIELRKNLVDLWKPLENWSVNANYTYVKSEVDLGDDFILTTRERPLLGQAENVFNLILGYEVPKWDFETRALFNYTGDIISDVGVFGLPDVIEQGRPNLDLLFLKRFGGEDKKKWKLEVQAENLLNRRIDFRQGNDAFQVYKVGRTFSAGIAYTFF
ncbi:MAG TPA: outer membrane beta-barrel protein [Blastocatellia bacterium]|nr:outer membrane beta-barrel protein [Blastocatellia bacterium]